MIRLTQTINMLIKGTEVGIFSDPHYGVHRNSEIWHKIALDHAKWAAAMAYCKQQGLIFRVITENDLFYQGKKR